MNRILFACLLVLMIAGAAIGQTSEQSAPLCNLPREKAPAIRGVKLGMTADEVSALIPGIRADYKDLLRRARDFPEFGAAEFGASGLDNDQTHRFDGIDWFSFRLFDDHLVQYSLSFKGPNSNPRGPVWPRADDLIARFADAYHLPGPANWTTDNDSRHLKCKGFDVQISSSNGARVVVYEPGNPWVAEQKKRREAFEEQLRRDFKP